jgi:hypothetical protein
MELKPGQKVRLVRIGEGDAYYGSPVLLGHDWTVVESHKNNDGSYNGYFATDNTKQGRYCFAQAFFMPVEGRNKL